ncbi:MAG: response regulator transcription factor [Bacteroidota bacterium]
MEHPYLNIVIADNQPIVTLGLQALLNTSPECEVLGVVDNGEALMVLLRQLKKVNTLFMDINLPETNIFTLVKELISSFPDLKVIIFSNYTSSKVVQSMMEYGVHAYLSKNADTQEILTTLHRVQGGTQLISPSVYSQRKGLKKSRTDLNIKDYFDKFSELTEREKDIIALLSRGMTNKEMALELHISVYTVETHRKNLMRKLNLKTSAQLVYLAAIQGVV